MPPRNQSDIKATRPPALATDGQVCLLSGDCFRISSCARTLFFYPRGDDSGHAAQRFSLAETLPERIRARMPAIALLIEALTKPSE